MGRRTVQCEYLIKDEIDGAEPALQQEAQQDGDLEAAATGGATDGQE